MRLQALRCDRCGELFLDEDVQWNFTYKEVDNKAEARKIDFCPHCINEFKNWISEYQKGES